eukprot:scaffold1492_cov257-Pinguiococcus_pyrenoidosus.AAC.2
MVSPNSRDEQTAGLCECERIDVSIQRNGADLLQFPLRAPGSAEDPPESEVAVVGSRRSQVRALRGRDAADPVRACEGRAALNGRGRDRRIHGSGPGAHPVRLLDGHGGFPLVCEAEAQLAVRAAGQEVVFGDHRGSIYAHAMSALEDQVGLLHQLPKPCSGVLPRTQRSRSSPAVHSMHTCLVAEERLHVRPLCRLPVLHRAVQRSAEQLLRLVSKRQTRHGVPVMLQLVQERRLQRRRTRLVAIEQRNPVALGIPRAKIPDAHQLVAAPACKIGAVAGHAKRENFPMPSFPGVSLPIAKERLPFGTQGDDAGSFLHVPGHDAVVLAPAEGFRAVLQHADGRHG